MITGRSLLKERPYFIPMKRMMFHKNKMDNEHGKMFGVTLNILPFGIGRRSKSRKYNKLYFISFVINRAKNTSRGENEPLFIQKVTSMSFGSTYVINDDYTPEGTKRD